MSTPPPRPPSRWRSIQAMAWALLGVRKGSEWHKDSAHIKPLQIVAVGVAAIFVFVLMLIAIVNWVV
ncbi:DUF2970 domain-containing protein [Comamonas jiangduensis]|uniref:DUF2970 domain-containing protein n=1 Tax=Comamonas jiangduensis TaxID=1194168 RepID=A0ABV4IGD1_9BURK|nr:DUF2970 domain-containing protein [Comamonas jiangduensis]QXW17775.1 DUF2970 domain-containing protein [Comamonas aquatica]